MKKGTRGVAQTRVERTAAELYEMVSDVTRMGQWSPETVKCGWIGGATGPAVGARFKGTNKRGLLRWSTKPKVVAADPGKEFAFETGDTRWTFRFEASGSGTDLTESFEMIKDELALIAFASRYLARIPDRKADLEEGMRLTLDQIKAAAERGR
jgi:hypothetical protein